MTDHRADAPPIPVSPPPPAAPPLGADGRPLLCASCGKRTPTPKTAAEWSHVCMAHCGGACCKHVAWGIAAPRTREDFERMRAALLHPSIRFFKEAGEWYIDVEMPCEKLRPDGGCGTYPTRPNICRVYEAGACEWPDGLDWEVELATDADLQAWLDERFNRKHGSEPVDDVSVAAVTCWPIDEPDSEEMFDEVRWGLLHRQIAFCVDADGDWMMLVAAPFVSGGPSAVIDPTAAGWLEYFEREADLRPFLEREHPGLAAGVMAGNWAAG